MGTRRSWAAAVLVVVGVVLAFVVAVWLTERPGGVLRCHVPDDGGWSTPVCDGATARTS